MKISIRQTVFSMALVTSFAGFSLVGCDVNLEDSGELPTVDVEPGELPDVDVQGPDVDVGTETAEVTVPDVDVGTEKAEVEVPTVDVDLPDNSDQ